MFGAISRPAVAVILWLIGLSVILPGTADAATRYVCGSVSACNTNNSAGGSSEWSGTPANAGACTSAANPCQTIRYGLSQMAAGDTLIIGNGTYQGAGATGNMIANDNNNNVLDLSAISGKADAYTVIKAENDWGVVIDGQGTHTPGWVKLNYGIIRGIQFVNSNYMGLRVQTSDHLKVLRCAAHEQISFGIALTGTPGDGEYTAVGSTNCLIEECVAYGSGSYFFDDNHYNGQGNNNIFRHNVVRRDAYSMSDNHYRSYQVYDAPSESVFFQNNLSLDSVPVMSANSLASSTPIKISSALVGTTQTFQITCPQGCGSDWFSANDGIAVYLESQANPTKNWIYASTATGYTASGSTGTLSVQVAAVGGSGTISDWAIGRPAGENVFSQDNQYGDSGVNITGLLAINDDSDAVLIFSGATGIVIDNSAFYLAHSIYPRAGVATYGSETITNCLVTGATNVADQSGIGFWGAIGAPWTRMENNIAYDNWRGFQQQTAGGVEGFNDAYGDTSTTDCGPDYCNFSPGPAATDQTINPLTNGLLYPTRIEADSGLATAGTDGGQVGPSIVYRYGTPGTAATCGGTPDGMSCTTFGDTGWNQLQNGQHGATTASMWPWPNEAVIKALMSEYSAHGVSGKRGFCSYVSPFGSPNTLTSYVWEYLGNPIPSSVYAGYKFEDAGIVIPPPDDAGSGAPGDGGAGTPGDGGAGTFKDGGGITIGDGGSINLYTRASTSGCHCRVAALSSGPNESGLAKLVSAFLLSLLVVRRRRD